MEMFEIFGGPDQVALKKHISRSTSFKYYINISLFTFIIIGRQAGKLVSFFGGWLSPNFVFSCPGIFLSLQNFSLLKMMLAFITFNNSLVPLIWGLCSSDPCGFEFSVLDGIERTT